MSNPRPAVDHLKGLGRHGGGGPGRIAQPVEKAEDLHGVLRRLWAYLRTYRGRLLAVAGLVVVTTVLPLINSYLIGFAVDQCILVGNLGLLGWVAGLMIVLTMVTSTGVWVHSVIMIHVSQSTVRDLRRDLFARLQVLSLRFFDRRPHGELMSRLTNDTETVSNTLGQGVAQLMASTLGVVGAASAMLLLNWRLALVSIATVPLGFLVTNLIANASRRRYRERQRDLGALNGLIEETITGQRVVKVCRREDAAIASFNEANTTLKRTAIRAVILSGLMGPCMGFVRNIGFAAVAAVGGWMVLRDWATVGTIAAFMTYARQFARPLHEIASLYGQLQTAIAGAERVFQIMDEQPDLTDAPQARGLEDVRGDVAFEDVSFGYDEGIPVLREVSLKAAPGQTIALVGPTGAGKTTIINLLTRFYDVDSGKITVDGQDIRTVTRDSLRQALGIVLQDTFLFADTVRENIRYGRLEATDEQVEEAGRLANADSFIRRLPQGYETRLSEAGSSLSQGQRQLLAIARAILADPAVLILDEATSSVDTRTEVHIQEAMLRLMAGRTSFVIAHRLSTIRKADCILVIDGGQIVERGTHAELMALQGMYWKLHTTQFSEAAAPLAAGGSEG